jgi:hypothetical protein
MASIEDILRIVLVGLGATLVLDAWLALLKRLGVKTLDAALIGRWVGHMAHGRFVHAAIAKAPPVAGEAALGWAVHYATGVAFAALLAAVAGTGWLHRPSPGPALAVGMATVALPLLVMQPAMGAGVLASRTPTPLRNCLRSALTHTVFGAGLYATAVAIVQTWP